MQIYFHFASQNPDVVVMSPMTYVRMGEPLTYINLPVLINVFVEDLVIVFAEVPKGVQIGGLPYKFKPVFRDEFDEDGED